jgi:hypothetical protein
MKNVYQGLLIVALASVSAQAIAGNDQKRGQAGATELTVNPWARSSGWANANSAGIRGVEAVNSNVAGLAYLKGTEILMSSTRWMQGTGVSLNALGIGQQLGKSGGVLGLSVVSWNLGDFYQTTGAIPDGNVIFSPSMINLGLSYAKVFSNSITGGITVRANALSVSDASASGISVDGAVQYQTHLGGADPDRKNLKFGVTLRNVGPELRFTGNGLVYRAGTLEGLSDNTSRAVDGRSETFEMPVMLTIGGQYDYVPVEDHRITFAATFVSNTFTQDQYQGGLEYAFMEKFMVRGGYDFMKLSELDDTRTTAHTGLTAGATVEVPFGKSADEDAEQKQHRLGIDYSFRATNPWNGTHSVGIRLVL